MRPTPHCLQTSESTRPRPIEPPVFRWIGHPARCVGILQWPGPYIQGNSVSIIHKKAGRPTSSTVEQRRRDLLATALDLFITHGYADVSLTMVAQVAHVAVRTIHVKFGGKDDLLRAIIVAEAESHAQQLSQLSLEGLSFSAKMERLSVHLWRRCSDNRLRKLQAIIFSHPDESLTKAWREANPGQLAKVVVREFATTTHVFADGMTPERLWEHFLSCIAGSYPILGGSAHTAAQTDPDERVRRALALFIRAVSPPMVRNTTLGAAWG